jgi:hypothetical protein
MNKLYIRLNSFDKIRKFIRVADNLAYNIELASGDFVVDGKLILGIFALDLSNSIELSIVDERHKVNICPKELEEFLE